MLNKSTVLNFFKLLIYTFFVTFSRSGSNISYLHNKIQNIRRIREGNCGDIGLIYPKASYECHNQDIVILLTIAQARGFMNSKKMKKRPSKHTNTENVQSPLNQKQRLWWKEWHLFLKLISKESPDFAFKFHLSGEKQERWTETQLHDHNHTTVQTHRTTTDLLFNQVKIKRVEVYTKFTDFKKKKTVMQKCVKKCEDSNTDTH